MKISTTLHRVEVVKITESTFPRPSVGHYGCYGWLLERSVVNKSQLAISLTCVASKQGRQCDEMQRPDNSEQMGDRVFTLLKSRYPRIGPTRMCPPPTLLRGSTLLCFSSSQIAQAFEGTDLFIRRGLQRFWKRVGGSGDPQFFDPATLFFSSQTSC